jgi:hypothetical protein
VSGAWIGRLACRVRNRQGIHHTQGYRQHHQCGGRVGNPQTQKRRDAHECTNDEVRTRTHKLEYGQGNAPMQTPAFERKRQNEPTKKQEDQWIAIGASSLLHGCRAKQGKQGQWQHGRDVDGNDVSDPPDRHPDGDSGSPVCAWPQ